MNMLTMVMRRVSFAGNFAMYNARERPADDQQREQDA